MLNCFEILKKKTRLTDFNASVSGFLH